MWLNSSMPLNAAKTLRNLRLKPGTGLLKKTLNSRRPMIVVPSNFFPGVPSSARPTVNTSHTVIPASVSVETMFPGPKVKSAFNLNAKTVRLRKRQENAIKEAEGKEVLSLPMNDSQGGIEEGGRRRTRKHRKHMRKHK